MVRDYEALIVDTAHRTNLKPSLVAALIEQESGGDPNVISAQWCVGLMQVGSDKLFPGRPAISQLQDPAFNLSYGCGMLAGLFATWKAQSIALAAYFGAIDSEGHITGAQDATGADGWDYVRAVESRIPAYLDLDKWAPVEVREKGWGKTWPEIKNTLYGVASDALLRLRTIRANTDNLAGDL